MEKIIEGIARHIRFRLVEEEDAAFILALRIDPEKSRFISPVENDLDTQRRWILDYKEREKREEEFYFIIEGLDGEKLGTIRLYDFRGDSFCWGSWILKSGAPAYAAVESALMIYHIAIRDLDFRQSHTDVRRSNSSVQNFLLQFGAEITGEDDLNTYFRMTAETYEKTRVTYGRFLAGDN
ncbi:GNAT family N-acetyltransferase [Prosthecochloris sp. GSB1]|uniref:GNAT family N-acetyltransferase n=1 Tax=Prosthecochloris sp. GSB1 TaxID=281093 RepID=UPI00142DFAD7|nr:GNAT family N-acetyltransferase [Prosthecochloris sp. GSB1]